MSQTTNSLEFEKRRSYWMSIQVESDKKHLERRIREIQKLEAEAIYKATLYSYGDHTIAESTLDRLIQQVAQAHL